ncbi:beta-propeller domain-containing protein, partial [Patescibacteria group bacterium]|nr:beta-propeller domain-containing protein [Patescibacteria group bacterium]
MAKKTRRQNDRIFFTRVVLVLAGVFLIFFISLSLSRMDFVFPRVISDFSGGLFKNKFKDIKKFSSEDDFKNYLAASLNQTASYGGLGRGGAMMNREIAPMDMKSANGIGGGAAERVSETNVQVAGIDEPDIVKTDGEEIYFSPSQIFRIWDGRMRILSEEKIQEAIVRKVETKIIKAFPPADLALDGKIDKQGDLLLDKNNLIVFSTSGYYGSQPASPELQ